MVSKSPKLVSIIIPTYNRAHLIGETLDSILAQTYPHWECIIVDDASTDSTAEIVEAYVLKDSRFRYYHRPTDRPKGASVCRNYGFELSEGDYLQWLDSDDIIGPNKIHVQLTALEENEDGAVAICKWAEFVADIADSKIYNNLKVYDNFYNMELFIEALSRSGGFLPFHAYFFRKELVHKSGLWLDELLVNQDGEFLTRLILKTRKIIYCDECLVYYRKSEVDNISNLYNEAKIRHAILSWIIIEQRFKIKFGHSTQLVKISKQYLYNRISNKFPGLIADYSFFFSDAIGKNRWGDNYLNKFRKKIASWRKTWKR